MQEAFSHLIGEQNELTQELASQGLSIVYELGDGGMKQNLVNALVGTLTGSGKRKRAVKVRINSFSLFSACLHVFNCFVLTLFLSGSNSLLRTPKCSKRVPLVKAQVVEN